MDRDPKWASAFGTIERGKKYTRFSLSVRLSNGLLIHQVTHVANNELEEFDGLYKFILDKSVKVLDDRIKARV